MMLVRIKTRKINVILFSGKPQKKTNLLGIPHGD